MRHLDESARLDDEFKKTFNQFKGYQSLLMHRWMQDFLFPFSDCTLSPTERGC